WKEHPRLYKSKLCGHDEIVPCNLDIKLSHHIEVFKILFGYHCDGNIIYINLILLYEMQKKIKRAFECLQSYQTWLRRCQVFSSPPQAFLLQPPLPFYHQP